jgi:hypothetical protein
MTKKLYLQFVRTLFIVVTLAGFGASNLVACLCASKKASSRVSCCDKVQKKPVKACCKTVPMKKVAGKGCCKMLCCVVARKQDSIIEANQEHLALAAISDLSAVDLQSKTISEKPFYRAAFAVPSAAELCVFLC